MSPRAIALILLCISSATARAEHLDADTAPPACAHDETCIARLLAHTLTSEQHEIVFHRLIEFEPGRVRVYSKGREKIQALVRAWKDRPDWSVITVDGYSGAARRSDTDNVALAQRRAERIRAYLIRYGIPGDRIIAVGHAAAAHDAIAGRFVDLTLELGASQPDDGTPDHRMR